MSLVHYPYEDIRRRFEEQQLELESLREQRRDKDAAINFLKTRLTTLQNKVNVHAEPGGSMGDGAIQALLDDKEQHIHGLERLLASAQQEMQRWSQGAMRAEEAGLLQQLREQDDEVEALRTSLSHCQGELQAVRSQGAAEIADLRHRLHIKDEEMHNWRLAMQDLEQHCQAMGDYNLEDVHRIIEENNCLSASLDQATLMNEQLQLQLHDKEQEAGLLAAEVKALQQKLCGLGEQRPQLEQPWATIPQGKKEQEGEEAALHAGETEPRASTGRRARTPPPLPRMPSTHSEATPTSGARSEVFSDAGTAQGTAWQDRAMAARGGDPPAGLQERKDTVLMLQQQIRQQIAEQRHLLGRDGPERPREAGATGSRAPHADDGADGGSVHLQAAPEQGGDGPQARPEPENYPMELTPEEVLAPTQKPRANASVVQRPGLQGEGGAGGVAASSPVGSSRAIGSDLSARGDACSSRGGGIVMSLHFSDREDSRLQKAKQQRMVRQMEQRHRLAKEKSRPDGGNCRQAPDARRPRPGEEAGPPLEQLPPEPSSRTAAVPATAAAGTQRRAGAPQERDSWDAWPVKSATREESLRAPRQPLPEDPEAHDLGAEQKLSTAQREEAGVPNLHKRFADKRDEMKRQRGSSDVQQSARTAESVLSELIQQRSVSRLPTAHT